MTIPARAPSEPTDTQGIHPQSVHPKRVDSKRVDSKRIRKHPESVRIHGRYP